MSFTKYYNNNPFGVLVISEENKAICAINKTKTLKELLKKTKEALSTEIDVDIKKIKVGEFDYRYYSLPIEVTFINNNDEEETQKFDLECAAIY